MNYFITAIDTDAGKTMITGAIARYFQNKGKTTTTMKVSQTGCKKLSEDIQVHRKMMEVSLSEDDKSGLTCPYIFEKPASPHLAAAKEGKEINSNFIMQSYESLAAKYEKVIVEGVGGLMVPMTTDKLLVEMIQDWNLPVILVSSGKLGSINHTLLSLEVMKNRNVNLYGIIYNQYPMADKEITEDSCQLLKQYMQKYYPKAKWFDMPLMNGGHKNINFDNFF